MLPDHQLDQPISGMTYRELRALIAVEVQARLSETVEAEIEGYILEPDMEEAAQALDWLREHRWTPPSGSPTSLDLLRQDRDRDA